MRFLALRAALRIARRDARRHRARSLLIITLIGLPVLILAVVDVGWRTYQLSPVQKLTREIGAADVAVRVYGGVGGTVDQDPKAWLGGNYWQPTEDGSTPPPPPTAADLTRVLPPGSRLITSVADAGGLNIRTKQGVQYAPLTGFRYDDPIASGMIAQTSGRAPRGATEVALTTHLAALTGLKTGDTLRDYGSRRSFTVVGVVQEAQHRHADEAFTVPAAVSSQAVGDPEYLIDTPMPVSWPQVRELNKIGFIAVARQPYLNPPPKDQIPSPGETGPKLSTSAAATIGLIAGMALLEVVLLAGPAFAVSARRQRRELALIAASGGARSHLRTVVLANGIVLGVTAGVVGALLGTGLVRVGIAIFGGRLDGIPGPFDVRPLELVGLALVAVVTALLAALVPAITAARLDVVAALAGRRGQTKIKRRVPTFGLSTAAVGVVVALLGASARSNVNLILAGVVITEVGLIILAPSAITAAAKLGRWLPFAPRLALRDASRNRASAAPAVAAIMAATVGTIAIALVATSQTDLNRRSYAPSLPANAALVELGDATQPGRAGVSAGAVAAVLRDKLDTKRVAPLEAVSNPACASSAVPNERCNVVQVQLDDPNGDGQNTGTSRVHASAFDSAVVDDGSAVSALFGVDLPRAETALRQGKVVIADSELVHDGKVTFWTSTYSTASDAEPVTHRFTVPGMAVAQGFPATQLILPPSVAAHVGVTTSVTGVVATLAHRPSTTERQAVNKALLDLDPLASRLMTEDGYTGSDTALWVLVAAAALLTLGAAAIATALANVDGRADLITLGAVGAAPRTRRIISAARAGVIAGLGCLIGTVAGFVPAVAWIHRQTNQAYVGYVGGGGAAAPLHLRLVIPWSLVAVAALGVPLIAALLAGAFTRSRLPIERSTF